MQSIEISLDQHLAEVMDSFDRGSAAFGIIAKLVVNEVDISILTPRQRNVWDRVIYPAIARNQELHDQRYRTRLLDED